MYKSITEWEWFKEHDMTCFFLYLLSRASNAETTYRGNILHPGELLVTREGVCAAVQITERRFRTIMNRMENISHEITTRPGSGGTIVTIVNWEMYQEDADRDCQEMRPTIADAPTKDRPKNIAKNQPSTPIADNQLAKSQQSSEKVEPSLFPTDEVKATEVSSEKVQRPKRESDKVDCQFVVKLYHDRCPGLPQVSRLTDARKTKIRLRMQEMEYSYETLQAVFDRAQASDFLRGDTGNRSWRCNFDWIFSNNANWVKIYEGLYDNNHNTIANETQPTDRYTKRRGADSTARSAEDYTDTL